MLADAVAQAVLNLGLESTSPLLRRVVRRLRSILVRLGDPSVDYALTPDRRLRLPLSHDLPYYRRAFPQYSQNVVDIARLLNTKYAAMACIDIGANVGDSALLLRQAGEFPVLCIEGDGTFLRYLRWNTRDDPKIEVAPVYIAPPGAAGGVVAGHGSAHLVLDAAGSPLPAATLEQILADHPSFESARLVKIDTDGMDVQIIRDNAAWLAARHPVLFFEYDPHLAQLDEASSAQLWTMASEAGYREAVFYENTGDFLLSVDLGHRRVLEDLHYRYERTGGARYADVCLLASEDLDLIEGIRAAGRMSPRS